MFFFDEVSPLGKKKICQNLRDFFSVNLKNIWKIMPKFPSHKIENKKTLNPAAKLKCVSFFGNFSHNGDIYFRENLEVLENQSNFNSIWGF